MDQAAFVDHAGDMNMGNSTMPPMHMPMHMNMPPMKMYFHFSTNEMILFKKWTIDSTWGAIWSSIVIMLACFVYEGIKCVRSYLRKKQSVTCDVSLIQVVKRKRGLTSSLVVDAILHFFQVALGYTIMLVIMTYNLWLCLATVLGESLALLFFRVLFPELDRQNPMEGTCCG